MRVSVRRTGRHKSTPRSQSASASVAVMRSLRHHKRKPSTALLTCHLSICILWTFTFHYTPRITPFTSAETQTTRQPPTGCGGPSITELQGPGAPRSATCHIGFDTNFRSTSNRSN